MTIKIDSKKALTLLRKAVKQKGKDYVDPNVAEGGCAYVRDGEASCIVGHVVAYVKPNLIPAIELWESNGDYVPYYEREERGGGLGIGSGGDVAVEDLARALSDDGEIDFDGNAVEILQRAQNVQDNGNTWGEALEAALVRAGELEVVLPTK